MIKNCKFCDGVFDTIVHYHNYNGILVSMNMPQKIFCNEKCRLAFQNKGKLSKRWEIFNRDNFTCQYCGKNVLEDKVKLELDHIKPKIDGGLDRKDNLVTACQQCNQEKGSKPVRFEVDFRERLRRKLSLS